MQFAVGHDIIFFSFFAAKKFKKYKKINSKYYKIIKKMRIFFFKISVINIFIHTKDITMTDTIDIFKYQF